MRPIAPTRILGGSVLAEGSPIATGVARVFRGVEIDGGADEGAAAPVIIREVSQLAEDEPAFVEPFEKATHARQVLTGSPAPRLLHTFGRDGRVLASVEEYVGGATLATLLLKGGPMPVALALAVARGLVPLWLVAEAASPEVRFLVDPPAVRIDGAGRVRVLPEHAGERARQEVGAALLLLRAAVSYSAPEQIMGARPDARSGMFTLGLLLYEMLLGPDALASEHASMFEILSSRAHRDVLPLRTLRPEVPAGVAELVHCCLERDPEQRFSSWRELARTLAAVEARFPPTDPAELARYALRLAPASFQPERPPIALWASWAPLPHSGYHPVPLPWATQVDETPGRGAGRPWNAPVLDPDALYVGADARPMYRVSAALLVDARPVTRAELERFCIVTGTARPAHLGEPLGATDGDACTQLLVEEAEAYARWAGKRLPTEAEWDAAVTAAGPERLDVGEVWEWTSTAHEQAGKVVRGGRWRDQARRPGQAEHRSFSTSRAVDLGFRCVADTPVGPPKER